MRYSTSSPASSYCPGELPFSHLHSTVSISSYFVGAEKMIFSSSLDKTWAVGAAAAQITSRSLPVSRPIAVTPQLACENERVGRQGGSEGGGRGKVGRERGRDGGRHATRAGAGKVGSADLSGLPATREAPTRHPNRPPGAHIPASAHAAGSDPVSPTVKRVEAGARGGVGPNPAPRRTKAAETGGAGDPAPPHDGRP